MSIDTLKVNIIKKAWEDEDFKARLLADPRSALQQEFGHEIPEGIELQVMAVTPTKYALIIPPKPEELDGLTAAEGQPQMYAWS